MKGRTILTMCPRPSLGTLSISLVFLLGMAALGWGQAAQTQSQRRTVRPDRLRTIQLPEASRSAGVSVEQALRRLMNLDAPSDLRLEQSQISQLLWAGQGVAAQPSGPVVTAEPLPAMRLYVSLPDGLYLYHPGTHTLQQTQGSDLRRPVASAALDQEVGLSPVGGCQIILAGVPREYMARFGARARNVMAIQAGQMAQSMQLKAVSLDLTFIATGSFDPSAVRRAARLARDVDPLYVLLVGNPISRPTDVTEPQPVQPGRRAVLIVPPGGFQDDELFGARRGLELAGVQTVIASTQLGAIVGMGGSVAEAELLISRVAVETFDAVVFIGGSGTVALPGNRMVLDLARRAVATNRVIAASGNAPIILAEAGIIAGARVTGLLAVRDLLLVAGAAYTGAPVERDGPLVTSVGPQAVPQFVRAIGDALSGR